MNLPGMTGITDDPQMWDKAEKETERLLETLKKEVRVEGRDIGLLRKELRITVPATVIAEHMEHNYSELMHDALVPGFRKGRAPRRLVEKRFGAEVRDSLTTAIVGQSFYAVAENEKIETLGDPLFRIELEGGTKLVDFGEAMQHLKLPAEGDFAYTCEVELKPSFELPALEGIPVKAADVAITPEMVEEHILRRRRLRGRFEPVTTAAQKDDQVIADVVLFCDGVEIKREDNQALGVRPARLEGIPLIHLDETLAGVQPGETRTTDCTIPPDFERADLRGKSGRFEFHVHEVKRLVPEPMEDFIKAYGLASEQELREAAREDLEAERDTLNERAKRAQVENYLLENTKLDLPTEFSARQTDRAVLRQVVNLRQRGMPLGDIEARIDELRTHASEEVARELKLGFVLEKVAAQLGIEVTDEEVNTAIARMAAVYNKRFDRVRDDLQSRGLLAQLVEQIRHDKCIDWLLKSAKIEPAAQST